MLRPQKGNSGVSFNDTLLNFGLRLLCTKVVNVPGYCVQNVPGYCVQKLTLPYETTCLVISTDCPTKNASSNSSFEFNFDI